MSQTGRAHSKFSASGAERWFECSASVEASEGQPDKTSVWAEEGTLAHKVLEDALNGQMPLVGARPEGRVTFEMKQHVLNAAAFILNLARKLDAEFLVETRIYLPFIHPEMFGTFDGAVIDHFGTLHVFDFKYGAGHAVRPQENLQMIFYGLGLAHKYHWNFKNVRLWIIQPRIKGYDGPTYWDVDIEVLRGYVQTFREAVQRVEKNPEFKEGQWCHWCKAKSVCPLKQAAKFDKAVEIFKSNPLPKGKLNGGSKIESNEVEGFETEKQAGRESPRQESESKGESQRSEAEWRKESKARKNRGRSGSHRAAEDFY